VSSPSKRLRQLAEIYKSLPNVECKGLCWANCAAVPIYDIELAQLERNAKRKLPVLDMKTPIGQTHILASGSISKPVCPLLVLRRCSAYEDRPLICRIFGVAEGLPCPHGCVPTRKLTDQEVVAIQRKMEKL
jgi:hypothetical protein